MRKFIEYTVKAILIVLVLLGYQALVSYTNGQFGKTFQTMWRNLSYAMLILSQIACGMILAYNERKSGKAGITKFVLVLIALILIAYPFNPFNTNILVRNRVMFQELVRVLSITFGILLTGIKL